VYTSVEPVDDIDVTIENAKTDDLYERSANYYVSEAVDSAPHGRIYDKEITNVEITKQPTLEYTYGDKLDLNGGRVKITYDSGLVEEDIPFDELQGHRIKLTYTDSSDAADTGDVLTVPYHNGRAITLTAESVHDVLPAVTDKISVAKRTLEYGECSVNSIVYDGKTTLTTGKIVFVNPQNDDDVTASGTFTFEDSGAGENKTVYITDIVLDGNWAENYALSSNSFTAVGKIEKAEDEPTLKSSDVQISNVTNNITIAVPEMTKTQLDGGAEFEYSIDGGNTWQKSNVFENPGLGVDCAVCVRFAETDNYSQSEPTEPVNVKTYLNKITLTAYTDGTVLASFYTNTESIKDEAEFKALIGEVGKDYYQCYTDAEGRTKISFPLILNGDVTIYTSLKKQSSGGGGGGSTKATAKPTASPTAAPTDISTDEPEVTPTPVPTMQTNPISSYKPYISGYEGVIWPDSNMTRAEAATIMVNLSGEELGEYENVFSDVSNELWYAKFIAQATAMGFISGFDDGNFRPEDTVTREQFATMISRLIKLAPLEGTAFEDVEPGRWSAGYIKAVYEKGIVSGYDDGTFRPENSITRAEAVRMANSAINLIPDKEAIDKILCPYADLPKSHWAYYEIMAASYEF
jgi:hypothetical protein